MPLTLDDYDLARFKELMEEVRAAYRAHMLADVCDREAWTASRDKWVFQMQRMRAAVEVRILERLEYEQQRKTEESHA